MFKQTDENADHRFITFINGAAVAFAYAMLALSLWLSTDVPLSTKGFWAMSVVLLTLALVNFVKYRFDARMKSDRILRIEEARNAKLLEDALGEDRGD